MADSFDRTPSVLLQLWDRGRAEKEARAMFASSALKPVAAALAGAHPHALDYIRQAPVIVLALAAGRPHRMNALRMRQAMRESLGARCRRGERLRDVMMAYGCAPQLRALQPKALTLSRWSVIQQLSKFTPSRLAPLIPRQPRDQEGWLRALAIWTDHVERRGQRDAMASWFEWAARSLSPIGGASEVVVTAVADLFIAACRVAPVGNARVDTRWTFGQAHAAAIRWHRALEEEAAERRLFGGYRTRWTEDVPERGIDYAPLWNEPFLIGEFEVVPLRSQQQLDSEGAMMRHCVASYLRDVRLGHSRIFSIRREGRRRATIELAMPRMGLARLLLVQARGPCNAAVSREIDEIARTIHQRAIRIHRGEVEATAFDNIIQKPRDPQSDFIPDGGDGDVATQDSEPRMMTS